MPAGSVGHDKTEGKEIRGDEPPALPITEPPPLDTDDCNEGEKKILQVRPVFFPCAFISGRGYRLFFYNIPNLAGR